MNQADAVHRIEIELPEWARAFALDEVYAQGDRMPFVLGLVRENIRRETGGPFAAAVFRRRDGSLLALGVNRVMPSGCSMAHAEMVALSLAQLRAGSHDLATVDGGCELVTSTEPCAMCLGAIPWSGVRRVVCGARDEDARAIGFDEGAKPEDWVGALAKRHIEVVRDVERVEAAAILREYVETGGELYNAGGPAVAD